jgi:hypothetical protein
LAGPARAARSPWAENEPPERDRMAIQFLCSSCRQPIEVDDEMANKSVTCPYCRQVTQVPAATTLNAAGTPPTATAAPVPAMTSPLPPGLMPLSETPQPPSKRATCGWIALVCLIVAVVFCAYCRAAFNTMMQGMNVQPKTPEEVETFKKEFNERAQSRPGLMAVSIVGVCVMPLAMLVFAIVSLARSERPRWPAITSLILTGLLIVLVCAGVFLKGMSTGGGGT